MYKFLPFMENRAARLRLQKNFQRLLKFSIIKAPILNNVPRKLMFHFLKNVQRLSISKLMTPRLRLNNSL